MNFVEAKYNFIANEQARKEDEEVVKYEQIRNSNHLMSDGSRKILENKFKESIINNYPQKSVKISKLFSTPVHQRLFIDNENRKKRIEELKNFYQEHTYDEPNLINVSHSRKVLDLTGKMSFTKN